MNAGQQRNRATARHRPWWVSTLQSIAGAAVVFFLLLAGCWAFLWFMGERPDLRNQRFDRERWHAFDAYDTTASRGDDRVWMVDDLLRRYELKEMTAAEVLHLLGEPERKFDFPDGARYTYDLGPCRGPVPIDHEWLTIYFDRQGRAAEASLWAD